MAESFHCDFILKYFHTFAAKRSCENVFTFRGKKMSNDKVVYLNVVPIDWAVYFHENHILIFDVMKK